MEMIRQMVKDAEVVSFDIFDTLIVRLYRKPTDLFMHLEESFQACGFKRARIEAEQSARSKAFSKGVHEITLQQIYAEIHPSYQNLINQELRMEKVMCRANPEIKKIYDFCLKHGKRIYISSDMYLPKETIEEILAGNGYAGYEKLLLSSETLRPKASGEMYEDLISAAGIEAKKIIHVGDNYTTDYENAIKKGITAVHYEPVCVTHGNNLNSTYFALLNARAETAVISSILEGMIVLNTVHNPQKSYWEQFAYKYAGILMVGYCRWLKAQFDKEGIKKAYFMLRDGYIVKRVFDELYPEFDTQEIYGSRRMFLLVRMNRYKDIQEYITSLIEGVSYKVLYDRLLIDDPSLYAAYCEKFKNQDKIITNPDEIHKFMQENEKILLAIADKESKVLAAYIKSIYNPGEKCAVVDLGWRCSMLKGLQTVCDRNGIAHHFFGYFLGTHPFKGNNLRVEAFGLNNGKSSDTMGNGSTMNSLYIIDILELIFSAPHRSVLKLEKSEKGFEPVFQSSSIQEEERMKISETMLSEIMTFTSDLAPIIEEFPVTFSVEDTLIPLSYFARHISPVDRENIKKVFVLPGLGNDLTCFPLTNNGRGRIALINPWPGVCGAESEALLRIVTALRRMGFDAVITDCQGIRLDEANQLPMPGVKYDGNILDFAITFNYETPKLLDCFYYHAVWSPPEMSLRLTYYADRAANNILMNDDFLLYNAGTLRAQIESICVDKKRDLDHASQLVASFSNSMLLEPMLENPKMFYCGMNWEKAEGEQVRHNDLFRLLDAGGNTVFYGPESVAAWGNIKPWYGYKNYKGSIPFDGVSILKRINECGICLVLSSDAHRRAGAATNRLYEACAAGAVIISDDNDFVKEHFSDAALFIAYNRNAPQDTFHQIMEKYMWIVNHKQDALALAKRAQEIYSKKFSAEIQLRNLIENHSNRMSQVCKDLFARNENGKVLVTYVLSTPMPSEIPFYLEPVIKNIQNQLYSNIELGIAVDCSIYEAVREYCADICANVSIISMSLLNSKGIRVMTDGECIRILQNQIDHVYFMNANADEVWFYDHVTTLVRTIEDSHAIGSYSGALSEDSEKNRSVHYFGIVDRRILHDEMWEGQWFPVPGQFMFRKEAHQFLPVYFFRFLDGKEHYAYANILEFKEQKKLSFSRRMTFVAKKVRIDSRNTLLEDDKQTRFIQELVKFVLPREVSTPNINISQALLYMPVKTWLRLRYYRFRMRKLEPDREKYKIFEKKYSAALAEYNSQFGT